MAYSQQTESTQLSKQKLSRLKDHGKSTNRGISRLIKGQVD